MRQYFREYKQRNKDRTNQRATELRQQARADVITGYGGRCACCQESGTPFLTLDHIGGGGKTHRQFVSGAALYRQVREQNYPYEYRILCWNCNCVLGAYQYCPHREQQPPAVVGLDTAGNRWHAVAIYPDGWIRNFGHQAITKGTPRERREQLVRRAQDEFAILPRGSSIWAEEPISSINGRTTITLSMAAGAIETAVFEQDLFWTWVPIQTWKCATVGNGNANKEKIKAWVQLVHGRQFRDDDSYDAYCLALYGQQVLARNAER